HHRRGAPVLNPAGGSRRIATQSGVCSPEPRATGVSCFGPEARRRDRYDRYGVCGPVPRQPPNTTARERNRMLIDTPTGRPHTTTAPAAPARRRHDDAPETAALFTRLAALEDGPERDAVRGELVTAWLPMAHRIAGRFRDRG